MAIEVMTHIWKTATQKGSALLMLLAIADCANEDGFAYPAVETLAEKNRTTVRSAQRMLDNLEAQGCIVIYNRVDPANKARHFSNVYQIRLPGKENAQPPPIFGELHRRIIEVSNDTSVTTVTTPASLPNDVAVTTVTTPASLNPLVVPSYSPPVEPKKIPPPAPIPRNPMHEAVAWAWQNGNRNYVARLTRLLTRTALASDGKYQQFQVTDPMTPLEVVAFRLWRDYLERDMPTVPETIQRVVEEFRGVPEYERLLEAAKEKSNSLGESQGTVEPTSPTDNSPIESHDLNPVLDALVEKLGG